MICAKFGWNWPSGSGEGDENMKSLRQQRQRQRWRQTTDKFWSEKLTWAFGSGKLKMTKNQSISLASTSFNNYITNIMNTCKD